MTNKKNLKRIYLITGFLGSGKTTLLKNIIELASNERIGIIMNEFGKMGIDGKLVNKNGIELLEINNGSIFCSCLKGSFIEGLASFYDLPIDTILVESSGLSDPSNIGQIIENVEKIRGKVYDYKGSICVVDGVQFLDQLELLVAIEKQIKYSDLIIINKVDLIHEEQVKDIEQKIRNLNPMCSIIKTSYGRLDFNMFSQNLRKIALEKFQETSNTIENKPITFIIKTNKLISKEKMVKFLKSISNDAYRIKGFLILFEGVYQVDVVGDQIDIKLTQLDVDVSKLVIISKTGLYLVSKVEKNWNEYINEHMILV